MQAFATQLQSLSIGLPVTAGNLTMFPLIGTASPALTYRLLDDALAHGQAEVTEVSDAGAVPELFFKNTSDLDILLVDGEELVGAKQNRVLNLTILVGAGQQVRIPVSCVEAGRWAWKSRKFESGGRKLNAMSRLRKMRGVSASLSETGTRSRSGIQSRVWLDVADKMAAFDCASETSSLHDVYAKAENDLAQVHARMAPQPDQVGAAFAVDGRLIGAELFDNPQTLARLLPKLVDSYAFDAVDRQRHDASEQMAAVGPSLDEVRQLIANIVAAPAKSYPAVAKGLDIRIEQPTLHAAALLDGDRLVHLSAFAADADAEAR